MAEQRRGRGPSIADEVAEKLEKLNNMRDLRADDLVEYADNLGDYLAREVKLKTSQIRKFLDAVNEIKSRSFREKFDFEREVILLRPKLAWAAGRQREVGPLMRVLDPCMKRVKDEKDFTNFARFVEAIVAYHRFHGGKD